MPVLVGGSLGITFPAGSTTPADLVSEQFSPHITNSSNITTISKASFIGNNGVNTPRGVFPVRLLDPYFSNVSLLLHGDGINGAQNNTFLDSSTNNFTIARNGNTTQGTFTQNPAAPGYWSNSFDGAADFLTVPANAAFDFGTGDWTVECWFYLTADTPAMNNGNRLACLFSVSSQIEIIGIHFSVNGNTTTTGTGFELYKNQNTEVAVVRDTTINKSTWYHAAVSKSASTIRIFLNGTQVGTSLADSTIWGSSIINPFVGRLTPTVGWNADFPGYISNMRVVKGAAVYTANFTLPTTPLTAIPNTVLLTCQSNTLKDNSTNNFTITRNGGVLLQPVSPFIDVNEYSKSVNGGSMYFDGTGDYLIASNTMPVLASDFTIECWIYCPLTTDTIVASSESGNNFQIFRINQGVAGNVSVYWNTNADLFGFSTQHISVNTWSHLAMTRIGTTAYLYVNGVQVASKTGVTDNMCKANIVGTLWLNGVVSTAIPQFNGYVSDYRVVNGTAVYTSNFTPPTAPLTAITNTSLLLKGTNAGIIDSSAKNAVETVGNAQVSTAVKKYGTGSMSFNGTTSYLQNRNPNFAGVFGTGNFTVEYWVYPTSFSTAPTVFDTRTTGTSSNPNGYSDFYTTAGLFNLYFGSTVYTSSTAVPLNTWTHIAVTRSGTSLRVFFNGTQNGSTVTNSSNFTNNVNIFIGVNCAVSTTTPSTAFFNGYVDDLRVTRGIARYTANFTPFSGPFPNQ